MDLEKAKILKSMTKSERFMYDLVLSYGVFDNSVRKTAIEYDISDKTVHSSLQKLVKKKLLAKVDFFVGKVKRCRYSVSKNIYSKNYNIQTVAINTDNPKLPQSNCCY